MTMHCFPYLGLPRQAAVLLRAAFVVAFGLPIQVSVAATIDRDRNGYIEIYTAKDLDAIRHDITAGSLHGIQSPWPGGAPYGYELMADIDFDTNGNGIFDSEDQFYNEGKGWIPISENGEYYFGLFNGNGFEIRNLVVNGENQYAGLFGRLSFLTVSNIGFSGNHTYVEGNGNVGVVVGELSGASFNRVHVSGSLVASDSADEIRVGGLVGHARSEVNVSGSSSLASISVDCDAACYIGGLVGKVPAPSVHESYTRGTILLSDGGVEAMSVGGLVGLGDSVAVSESYAAPAISNLVMPDPDVVIAGVVGNRTQSVTSTYWDAEQMGVPLEDDNLQNSFGLTSEQMTCPTAPSDIACRPGIEIYSGWSGQTWNMGDSATYPVHNGWYGSVDRDGDGLIEIRSLADLHEMRNDLSGRSLYGSSEGCVPECHGYELVVNLDFDTDGSGASDAGDIFWNSGLGWEPIGNLAAPFTAQFNGNFHVIRNLDISRPDQDYIGLFGMTTGRIHDVILAGSLTDVEGREDVGALVGMASGGSVEGVTVSGSVAGISRVGAVAGALAGGTLSGVSSSGLVSGVDVAGGLVGDLSNVVVRAVHSQATVSAEGQYAGGIAGTMHSSDVKESYVRGVIAASQFAGALTGMESQTSYEDTYWSSSLSGQLQQAGLAADDISAAGTLDLSEEEFQCPERERDTSCRLGAALFSSFGEAGYEWDFGTVGQFPEVVPFSGFHDLDGDGWSDVHDAFPRNEAAYLDNDGDGMPDAWNSECDVACQSVSGLSLDANPDDALPVARAGGPYLLTSGAEIICSAAESFDREGGIVLYEWDLDDDGVFDDASGSTCVLGADYSEEELLLEFRVGVRVTDSIGQVDTDYTALRIEMGPAPARGSDSGGGSWGLWGLLACAALGGVRRRPVSAGRGIDWRYVYPRQCHRN